MRISDWSSDVCSSDRELGEDYTRTLRNSWPEVPGGVDLVCYWFAKAWAMMAAGRLHRAGLVSTNSIRGGVNREVLKPIVDGGRIFEAWSDEGWTVEGAAVRVSIVCFSRGVVGPSAGRNGLPVRSEEHTSELQSLMRTSSSVFC